MQKQSTF